MSDVAIKFENVSKLYELGTVGTGTLSHDLKRWWITSVLHKEDPYLKIGETNDRSTKGDSKFVYALKDIDFEVKQGDVLGIIGKNGAGKSTLLKLLSRVTAPTTGKIYTKGRIASLLEVGTGFHPELTGRENIYMNGTILGMKKWEIDKQLDEIIDFSGCERYLDTPVKRYSSGMTVRLGFAIAAHLNPEILVVDEVLAVGDAEFQKKALGKMQDVSKGEGRTVLFVSHNMNSIKSLCKSCVVLQNGISVFEGETSLAISYYLKEKKQTTVQEIINFVNIEVPYISVKSVTFNGSTLNQSTIFKGQKTLEIQVCGQTKIPIFADLSFSISIGDDSILASFSEGHFTGECEKIDVGEFCIKRTVKLPRYLFSGDCLVSIGLHQPGVVSFFKAENCVKLHFDGNFEDYGRALGIDHNGLFGFESI